jgi:hypothetical protein
MSAITQPFRNWIYFRHPMKGLEASLMLSLLSVASVRELISPNGLLAPYLARNWTFFRSVEPSIYFRNFRKRKCTCWSQGTPFSNSISLKSQTGRQRERERVVLFSYSLTCAASIAVVEKRMCMRYTLHQISKLYRVRRSFKLSWLSGPVGLHKLNSKLLYQNRQ